MGRLEFGYKPPPNDQTPLVLDVFNPTFWVMVEMTLGVWAANLPALAPILKNAHVPEMLSGVYRKLSSSMSSSVSKSAVTTSSDLAVYDPENARPSIKSETSSFGNLK